MSEIYKPRQSSILQYLNYCYLRCKNGFEIPMEEKQDVYKYYQEYCQENEIEFYNYTVFYRELMKYGVKSGQMIDPKTQKRRRYKELTSEGLARVFKNYEDDYSFTSSQVVKLNNVEYHMVTKFIRIDKVSVTTSSPFKSPSAEKVDEKKLDEELDKLLNE